MAEMSNIFHGVDYNEGVNTDASGPQGVRVAGGDESHWGAAGGGAIVGGVLAAAGTYYFTKGDGGGGGECNQANKANCEPFYNKDNCHEVINPANCAPMCPAGGQDACKTSLANSDEDELNWGCVLKGIQKGWLQVQDDKGAEFGECKKALTADLGGKEFKWLPYRFENDGPTKGVKAACFAGDKDAKLVWMERMDGDKDSFKDKDFSVDLKTAKFMQPGCLVGDANAFVPGTVLDDFKSCVVGAYAPAGPDSPDVLTYSHKCANAVAQSAGLPADNKDGKRKLINDNCKDAVFVINNLATLDSEAITPSSANGKDVQSLDQFKCSLNDIFDYGFTDMTAPCPPPKAPSKP
jgi:hypothetical protein